MSKHKNSDKIKTDDSNTNCGSKNNVNVEISDGYDDDSSISTEGGSDSIIGTNVSRPRALQDIWDPKDVWERLQTLPGGIQLTESIKSGNLSAILNNNYCKTTGILIVSWLGLPNILEEILINTGVSGHIIDSQGRSALHLAAYTGQYECCDLLIKFGSQVNSWDLSNQITPLHCAACSGNLDCVKLLIESGADVNAGLNIKSPLHYAIQSNAIDCAEELLKAGASPTTPQVFTETPLHVAAALGLIKCIELLIKYGAEVRVQYGLEKMTPLHLAAEDGNVESTRLLLNAGAEIITENSRKQTPLHLAALSQSSETIELLLNHGANPNAEDVDGRTPLHSSIVKVTRYCECVILLINAGANVNKPDNFGYTPLHIAALNEFSNCVILLINNGGDITARTKGGISALSFIIRRTPDVIPKYISKLDKSIKLNDHDIGDVDCELKIDFRMLVPSDGKGETDLMLSFIEVGEKQILKHPLCETFLHLKWKRIRKFFLFSLIFHMTFVFLFTAYVISVFLKDCPRNNEPTFQINCKVHFHVHIISYFLYFFTGWLFVKELFQMAHGIKNYFFEWENLLQLLIIASVPLISIHGYHKDISKIFNNWQHHVAAIAIFLTWLELMVIVGRFPTFGLYIQMFQRVALNFLKFLIAYCCLLIAFSLCFGVLFTNYPSFKNLIWGFIKIVIMMSGELEFEDIFYQEEYQILYPVTAHILFFAFVILVTIILSNLMVGLAVNDIQGLQQSAGLDRLVRQAHLVAHLESMLFSRLLVCVPKRILDICHRSALLLSKQYPRSLYIRPNDPRENRIPKYLIQQLYKLVAERKEKPKERRVHNLSSIKKQLFKNQLNNNTFDNSDLNGYSFSVTNVMPVARRLSSVTYENNCVQIKTIKSQIAKFSLEMKQNQQILQHQIELLLNQLEELENRKEYLCE